ncbi:MAG: hypothetical protein ACXVLQ_15635 [Bacteriovorax sp.]
MIFERLPEGLRTFLTEIEGLGFSLCLVGGAPRDYFFSDTISNDLDFEIRPVPSIEKGDWPLYYKKLHLFLSEKKCAFTEFPYLITRTEFAGYKLEFSSPRLEINKEGNLTHHHFDAILDPALGYVEAFKRRDFTINAIGLEFHCKEKRDVLIDPYGGVDDLKNGILKNISEDFFLDSVRFLRLIRFQVKFNRFAINKDLYAHLDRFNLSLLSVHHFKEELFKSRPGEFLNLFSKLIKEKKLEVPALFKIWTEYNFPVNLKNAEDILVFIYLQDKKEAQAVSQFFSMPEKKLRDIHSFFESYKRTRALKQEDFKHLLNLPIEEVLGHEILRDLKNLEEKRYWKMYLDDSHHDLLVDWSDWEKIQVSPSELQSLAPALRSYYVFYKTIEKIFK